MLLATITKFVTDHGVEYAAIGLVFEDLAKLVATSFDKLRSKPPRHCAGEASVVETIGINGKDDVSVWRLEDVSNYRSDNHVSSSSIWIQLYINILTKIFQFVNTRNEKQYNRFVIASH